MSPDDLAASLHAATEAIRARVPDYPGVADLAARRASDQHLRAWAGERLAELRSGVPAGPARDRLDDLILACEFGNQQLMKAFEEHGAFDDPKRLARYLAADAATVAAVDASVAAAGSDAFERALGDLAAALAQRIASANHG